jgi:hypothetical protein
VKNLNNMSKLVGLLVILVSLQATAMATYTPYFLPESSLWQGSRFYDKPAENVNAYVEYAVYDTWSSDYKDSFNFNIKDSFPTPAEGTGEYLYAYVIYNMGTALPPVAMFELIGGNPANASGIGYNATNAGAGAISPTSSPTTSSSAFVWKFAGGIFVADKNSAFLVFTSDHGPVAGSFKLSTLSEGGDEPPNPETPEPATIAMLAAGAIGILRKRIGR